MTQIEDFRIGDDGKLYVVKRVPEANPVFTAILEANEEDRSSFFAQVTRVSSKLDDRLDLSNFTKIPFEKIMEVWSYFKAVYNAHRSEAIVLFHFDDTAREYTIVVPESYTASASSVLYDPNQVAFCPNCRVASKNEAGTLCPRGSAGNNCLNSTLVPLKVRGTMHSHGSMGAFHSGTDDDHELNQTGFHITMGRLDQPMFELCPSFVVAAFGYRDSKNQGIRFKPPLDALVDFSDFQSAEPDQHRSWMSVAFTPTRLTTLPDSASVVLEESSQEKSAVVYANSEQAVQEWLSRQPATRVLRTCTGSEVKKVLPPTVERNGSLSWVHEHTITPTTGEYSNTGGTKQLVERIGRPKPGGGLKTLGPGSTKGPQKIWISDEVEILLLQHKLPMLLGKGNKRLDPWSKATNFSDVPIPREVMDYAVLRLTWDLDIGLARTLDFSDLHKAIATFTEFVSSEFGPPGSNATLMNSKETKPMFQFLDTHFDRDDPPRSSLLTIAEKTVKEAFNLSTDPLKRVLVMLAYMSEAIDYAFRKNVINYKELSRVTAEVCALKNEVIDTMQENWSSQLHE